MSPLLSIAARRHPAVEPVVRRERALVVHPPGARADLLEAVPARRRTVAADVDRVARDEGLPAAEVAVLSTPHRAIGSVCSLTGRPRLRDARAVVAEVLVVRGRLDVGVVRDRHRRRARPVDRCVLIWIWFWGRPEPSWLIDTNGAGAPSAAASVAVGVSRKRRRQVRVDRLHVLVHEARRLAVRASVALEGPDARRPRSWRRAGTGSRSSCTRSG